MHIFYRSFTPDGLVPLEEGLKLFVAPVIGAFAVPDGLVPLEEGLKLALLSVRVGVRVP